MVWFWLTLGAFAYLQFGYQLGRLAFWTWTDDKSPAWLKWLLFTGQYYDDAGSIGATNYDYYRENPFIWIPENWIRESESTDARRDYRTLLAFFWPIKLLANAGVMAAVATWSFSKAIASVFIGAIRGPEILIERLLERRARRRIVAKSAAVGGTLPVAVPVESTKKTEIREVAP